MHLKCLLQKSGHFVQGVWLKSERVIDYTHTFPSILYQIHDIETDKPRGIGCGEI